MIDTTLSFILNRMASQQNRLNLIKNVRLSAGLT